MKVGYVTTSNHELGLRSISSSLKKHDLVEESTLYSFPKRESGLYSEQELKSITTSIEQDSSEVYFFTIRELDRERTFQLARVLKSANPKAKLVVGGTYALANPGKCSEYFDYVVVGEGEKASRDILQGNCNKGFLLYSQTPQDELPVEDYELPVSILQNGRVVDLEGRISRPFSHPQYENRNEVSVSTMRGCSYSCSFCEVSQLREEFPDYKLRKKDLSEVVSHLERLIKRDTSIEYVHFFDEDFLLRNTPELERFAGEYRAKVGLPFFAFVTPSLVKRKPERVELLGRAGLNQINMGIQSGSQRIAKNLFGRRDSNDDILNAVNTLVDATTRYSAQPPMLDFIVLNPYETRDDMMESIELIRRLPKPFNLITHSMNFFKGTPLHRKAIKDGVITPEYAFDFDLHNFIAHSTDNRRLITPENLYFSSIIYRMRGIHQGEQRGSLTEMGLEIALDDKIVKLHLANPELTKKENSRFPSPMAIDNYN